MRASVGGPRTQTKRTFMRSATVSANVGIDCLGSLLVLSCSMPSGPYQFCSLIFPSGALSDPLLQPR